jgi:hypothetical protein
MAVGAEALSGESFNFFAGLFGSIFGGGNHTFYGSPFFGPMVKGPYVVPVPGPAHSTISVSSTGQEPKTESIQKLADIGDLIRNRDGSSDQAPTKYHFIWFGVEKNFRAAVEIIEMNIKRKLVFTEMFRDTAQQQKLWDDFQDKRRRRMESLPEEYGFIRNRSDDSVHFTFRGAAEHMRMTPHT